MYVEETWDDKCEAEDAQETADGSLKVKLMAERNSQSQRLKR